jgi:hypothetical protein
MSAPKAKYDILPAQHTVHQAGREADARCGSDPEAAAHAKIVRLPQLPPWLSAAALLSSPRITILSVPRERLHHAAHCRMLPVFHLDPECFDLPA